MTKSITVIIASILIIGCSKSLESEVQPHLKKIIGITSPDQAKLKDLHEYTHQGKRSICGKVSFQNLSKTANYQFVEFIFEDYENQDITVNYGKLYNDQKIISKFNSMLSIACPGYN